MEEVKQSLQETASKERESYKSVFLKKRSVCNRQSVYISGDTKTYRSDCRRDYKQTSKHRKFH